MPTSSSSNAGIVDTAGPLVGDDDRSLAITRLVDVPASALWRGWTEPFLLRQWFAPKPWTTPVAELDVRVGGIVRIVMRGPDGVDMPSQGVYLAVEPNRRLVFTDAFVRPWVPSEKPFMTGEILLEEEAGRTRYTARVHHWSAADRDAHAAMGFHQGWNTCLDQLLALVGRH